MLPIALLLLVVNVLAEPSNDTDIKITSDTLKKAWKIMDPYAVNYFAKRLQWSIGELANQSDRRGQALATAQSIAMLGYYARKSTPEEFCAQINVIKAVTNGDKSSDDKNATILKYMDSFNSAIDSIVCLITNPESYIAVHGPGRDVCNNPPEWSLHSFGSYSSYIRKWKVTVNNAWQLVQGNADPQLTNLLKKLYPILESVLKNIDFNQNNFNVAIATVAASLPDSTSVFEKAFEALARFLVSITTKDDIEEAGEAAKDAVSKAFEELYLGED